MKKFKVKYVDKLAHVGEGAMLCSAIVVALLLLGSNVITINVIAFTLVSAWSIVREFMDDRHDFGNIDMYDAIASIVGAMITILMFNL